MTQALYAHMNNKKVNKVLHEKKKKYPSFSFLTLNFLPVHPLKEKYGSQLPRVTRKGNLYTQSFKAQSRQRMAQHLGENPTQATSLSVSVRLLAVLPTSIFSAPIPIVGLCKCSINCF
jgi:hypothetical protein